MEVWRNSRRELFEQLRKSCDKYEQSLAHELQNNGHDQIRHDELGELRKKVRTLEEEAEKHGGQLHEQRRVLDEKESRIGSLLEENLRLSADLQRLQNASEAANRLTEEKRLGQLKFDQQLLEEKDAKIRALTEENSKLLEDSSRHLDVLSRADQDNRRLEDDLKKYQAQVSRLDQLEKQNKHLSTELSNAAIRARDSVTPSTDNLEKRDSPDRDLPKKQHNKIYVQWAMQKDRADKLAEKQRELYVRLDEWQKWSNEQGVMFRKKTEKIQKQGEEINRLRAIVQELGGGQVALSGNAISSDPTEGVLSPRPSGVHRMSPLQDVRVENLKAEQPKVIDVSDNDKLEQARDAGYNSPELPRHETRLHGVHETQPTQIVVGDHHHSSSTEGDPEPSISPAKADVPNNKLDAEAQQIPSSDDTPVVISARSLRKRKRNNNELQQTPVPKVKIEEVSSSSPLALSRLFMQNESLDLDAIGEKVVTPRKRLRTIEPDADENNEEELLLENSIPQKAPATAKSRPKNPVTPARRSVGTVLQPLSPNKQILPTTTDVRLSKRKSRRPNDKFVEELIEDGDALNPTEPGEADRKMRSPSSKNVLTNLLTSPAPTKPAIGSPRKSYALDRKTRSKLFAEARLEPAETDIDSTESRVQLGDNISNAEKQDLTGGISKVRGKENTHLTPSGVNRSSMVEAISRPASRTSGRGSATPSRSSSKGPVDLFPPGVKTPAPSVSKPTPRTRRKPRGNANGGLDSDDPDQEPLRCRPLEKLSLEHFKVNPKYNGGRSDAFTDVVRGKENRRCLQGCTKPECCGNKFRVMAQALRDPSKPVTGSQEERDDDLLEEYLGDNKHKLRNMSKKERAETLLAARTWELSNKYGKHRHRYERRSTPPGFWNADFPTTQEDQADREAAKILERKTVEERYQQAMRPGGAWIFRDE
ncbi:hypothetical protein CJF31_00010276 [Rutstroemia sp. NJR-2017a BVV2]|nr:hypothetical protein CJF31_00010276 [Rutstroemia sp. NJR-2017a BVV2]